jgi:hypothetical protein
MKECGTTKAARAEEIKQGNLMTMQGVSDLSVTSTRGHFVLTIVSVKIVRTTPRLYNQSMR